MRPVSVLVVDDDSANRALLAAILAREVSAVCTAADAEEATALLKGRIFDLLITDVEMPGLDGIGLSLRVRREWPSVKVIVVSGVANERIRAGAERTGAGAVLEKPFSPALLLETIDRLLQQAERQS